jgi:hypothetical protein
VTIGSTVDALGEFSSIPVLKGHITATTNQVKETMTMRGQSDLVYTTDMNQASIGVAGSYGVQGVEQLTSAVTAYFGYSSAKLDKRLSVVYEIVRYGGFEYIDFNKITPLDMLESLTDAPKNLATQVFDQFNNYMRKLDAILEHPYVKAIEWSLPQVLDLFRDKFPIDEKHQKLKSLAQLVADARGLQKQWVDKAAAFRRNYGEGMVVGVLWGGIGQANMTVVNQAQASAWKYGGASKFSYAGLAQSVAVDATYDASGTQDMSQVRVYCEGDYSAHVSPSK